MGAGGWGHTVGVLKNQAALLGGGCLGLRFQEPGRAGPCERVWCGVGLLFEIWIVDASIFVVCCVHCLPGSWSVSGSRLRWFSLCGGFGGAFFLWLVVVWGWWCV